MRGAEVRSRSRGFAVLRRLLLLALGVAAGYGLAVLADDSHRIVVRNASGQTVTDLAVEVGAARYEAESLADGESVTVGFVVRQDSAYRVAGTLADGARFEHSFGYVTPGVPRYRASAVIGPGGAVEGSANW